MSIFARRIAGIFVHHSNLQVCKMRRVREMKLGTCVRTTAIACCVIYLVTSLLAYLVVNYGSGTEVEEEMQNLGIARTMGSHSKNVCSSSVFIQYFRGLSVSPAKPVPRSLVSRALTFLHSLFITS